MGKREKITADWVENLIPEFIAVSTLNSMQDGTGETAWEAFNEHRSGETAGAGLLMVVT